MRNLMFIWSDRMCWNNKRKIRKKKKKNNGMQFRALQLIENKAAREKIELKFNLRREK